MADQARLTHRVSTGERTAVIRRPRLVATDLDGTFLRSDGSVSARTARVWAALPEHGIETVIVTARPPRWLHDLRHVVGAHGIAICGNGAFVYAVETREVIEQHCFDPVVLAGILADLRRALPQVLLATETVAGPVFEDGWPDPRREVERVVVRAGDDDGLLDRPVGKLLALAPGLTTEQFSPRCERWSPTADGWRSRERSGWPRSARRGCRRRRLWRDGAPSGGSRPRTYGPSVTCRTTSP